MKARKLGTNVVEAFKVNAYAGAAKNISLLDYDVTKPGSGKGMLGKMVKGQKVGKVAGIGKGIAEMVDHWIDNGRQTFGKKWEEEGFAAAAAAV
jgi:DNA polymerase/3'-5' exonuclease PolX